MDVSGEFTSAFEIPEPKIGNEAESTGLFAQIPVSLLGTGQAKIEYSIDDVQHRPFAHYGVRATPGNPDFIRKGYPVIEIIASSDSGHLPWRLSLILDPYQVVEGKNQLEVDHFTVWAQMTQGEPGSAEAQTTGFGISGSLELDRFSLEPGAPVSGRFHLKAPAFKPGK